MVEFEYEGSIILKNYDFHFMPCVGDKVVINNLTYKIKSRVFKCQGKTVKVVLKRLIMRIRIVKYVCADGVERGILEYRNHWWEKWEPLHQEGKLAYVSYMGTKPYKSLQEECFDVLGLNEEQIKVREQMSRYILDAEEVYIGARIGNEYRIGYDVDNDESLETLRNLEE